MEITPDLVRKVAKSARLHVDDAFLEKLVPEFEEIMALFEDLKEVDVSQTHASLIPIDKKNHVRDDVVSECLTQDEALKNAKNRRDGFFRSPRAIQ